MYKFCNKCGNITFGNQYLEEKCWVCGNVKIPVPTQYIRENEILTDKELKDRSISLIEELVKTSPEFDQYLFEHREEILAKKNSQYQAALDHGKAILEEQKNVPKCPTCGSVNIRKVSVESKAVSVGLFGIFSQKVKKQFHCGNCGYEW